MKNLTIIIISIFTLMLIAHIVDTIKAIKLAKIMYKRPILRCNEQTKQIEFYNISGEWQVYQGLECFCNQKRYE